MPRRSRNVIGEEPSSNPVSMTKGIARITLKTQSRSYQCGAVRFEVDVDIAEGTKKCNCASCSKARSWLVFARANVLILWPALNPKPIISGRRLDTRDQRFDFTFANSAAFARPLAASWRRWVAPSMLPRSPYSTKSIPTSWRQCQFDSRWPPRSF
jgi:hypothetical protein